MQNLKQIVTVFGAILLLLAVTLVIMLSIAVPSGPVLEIERFDGYPAGLVVAGERPDGSSIEMALFPNLHLSASDHEGRSATLTLQQSGTRSLLIIADDLRDEAPRDGYLDQPRIAATGGEIEILFELPTSINSVALSQLTGNSQARLTLYHGVERLGVLSSSDWASERGEFKLSRFGPISKMIIYFDGHGAIEQIEYSTVITATETESWGTIKRLFGN